MPRPGGPFDLGRLLDHMRRRIEKLERIRRSAGGGGGGAPSNASYVTTAAEAGLSAEKVLGTDVIKRGTAASKPASPDFSGQLYIETDGSFIVWRGQGVSWNEIARGEAGIRLAQLAERSHANLTGLGVDDHTQYALDTDLSTHAGAVDPHTGYVLESLLDAAGDLYVASGDNTPARLAVGNDGEVLTVDTSLGPKVKWAPPVRTGQATVDFGFAGGGEGDTATASVSATWVTATSKIVCSVAAVATADHDAEDAVVEGLVAYPTNLQVGVGFDVEVYAPQGTWGRYLVYAIGV